jgi:prepilin-type processing-associated H-X9-DG protein/prepilin-type N-terminal cleavage/methylation domain-containing protein
MFPLKTSHLRPPRRAFTLVELLASVAIVACLAALLFPTATSIMDSRKSATCLANLRTLAQACLVYASDNSGVLPPYSAGNRPWNQTIAPYLADAETSATFFSKALHCPADPRPYRNASGTPVRSYVLSGTPSFDTGAGALPRMGVVETSSPYRGRPLAQVSRPSATILLAEWFSRPDGTLLANLQNSIAYSVVSTGWVEDPGAWGTNTPRLPGGKFCHKTGLNYAFVDGHVATVPPAEVNPNWRWPQYDTRWVARDQ